jgi:hypothetical protein
MRNGQLVEKLMKGPKFNMQFLATMFKFAAGSSLGGGRDGGW